MGDGWPNHALLTFANPQIRNHFWRWIDQNPQQAPINLPGSKLFCKPVPKGYILLGGIARATTSDSSSGLGSISSPRPPRSSEVGSGSSWGDWCNRKPADDSGEPNDTTRHRDEDWENEEKPRGGPAAAGRTASAPACSRTTHKTDVNVDHATADLETPTPEADHACGTPRRERPKPPPCPLGGPPPPPGPPPTFDASILFKYCLDIAVKATTGLLESHLNSQRSSR